MIDATIILLIPLKDYRENKVCKYAPYWGFGHPFWLYDYQPLRKIFKKVIVYDYIERMLNIGLKEINNELISLVKKEKPKYLVWPSVNFEFLESTFDKIRREGSYIVGLFFDDEFRFDNYSKYWIPHLDFCVTNVKEVINEYKKLGAYVIHVFVCHNVPVLNIDWSNIKMKYDVSFVGSRTYDRYLYIKKLLKLGINVHVAGRGWTRRGWISLDEMLDIFKSSKINLNFSRTNDKKFGWKGRILEVINAGGFLLTEYRPGIEEFFEIDKEIVCFRNFEEMVEKIIYYLNHEEERSKIARAGWEKGIANYTPFHMYSKIFTEIESVVGEEKNNPFIYTNKIQPSKEFYRMSSNYYMRWGKAFLIENYKGLWKDALSISLFYNPSNWQAKILFIIGYLPTPIRFIIMAPYVFLFKLFSRVKSFFANLLLPPIVLKLYYKIKEFLILKYG